VHRHHRQQNPGINSCNLPPSPILLLRSRLQYNHHHSARVNFIGIHNFWIDGRPSASAKSMFMWLLLTKVMFIMMLMLMLMLMLMDVATHTQKQELDCRALNTGPTF
jgi:hypothetical protein